nr:hypothetical protein Iba_chr12fCG7080 [Ipomoea batatas]
MTEMVRANGKGLEAQMRRVEKQGSLPTKAGVQHLVSKVGLVYCQISRRNKALLEVTKLMHLLLQREGEGKWEAANLNRRVQSNFPSWIVGKSEHDSWSGPKNCEGKVSQGVFELLAVDCDDCLAIWNEVEEQRTAEY